MSSFAVIREAGPAWTDGGIYEQSGADDHAAFMGALAEEGFVVFAGPLAGTETGLVRVLLIIDADEEAEIHRRLAEDPWVRSDLLRTTSVERWLVLVGADRLP
jgi:uncharacterized protein YciI